VLVRLELPLAVNEQNGPMIVEHLNRWELATPDLPPLFGAWCMGTRIPTFVTFVPDQMCGSVHDLLRKLLIWNGVRHEMLCKWLLGSNIWA